jgi:hypothetical protein
MLPKISDLKDEYDREKGDDPNWEGYFDKKRSNFVQKIVASSKLVLWGIIFLACKVEHKINIR